ncbi:hypothetical protein JYB87_04675 [Shewanella avicenniae]|uniref:Lipoprotein n=1 Tax=Shewanella avicenniae TaxID=2814294 RepID=A0ABX7QSW5_9GAMM|nr:hypothetical protein [Shewanella avicenniae]QSX34548.1 hypothetical protein JYB87_04675 [Shewanella avicenniae]
MNHKGLLLPATVFIVLTTITGCSTISQNVYDETAKEKNRREQEASPPQATDNVSHSDIKHGVVNGSLKTIWDRIVND